LSDAEGEPFDYAAALGINFLPSSPQDNFSEHAEEMREAAKNPDPEVLRQLLQQAVDVNLVDENGWTGLMWAAAKNSNPEVIKLFIKYGADVNAPTTIGWSVSMLAAMYNQNPEIIRTLAKEGADLNAKDAEGNSVLEYAAENRNPEVLKVVEELLKVK
jgi:ankyrin repeat protein